MSVLTTLIDFIIHIDVHLEAIIAQYGVLTYAILFAIIFCETGLVVTPFLPGDSLLFAAGAFAARGAFDPWLLFGLIAVAAVLGDTVNYAAGAYLGPKVFRSESRLLNKQHLLRAQSFYEQYGNKTIIIARFIPIIRTLAPFVAGIGRMEYSRFISYNVIGGLAWVALFVFGGYYFGTIPAVEHNFSLVILGIIVVSLLPPIIDILRHRFGKPKF